MKTPVFLAMFAMKCVKLFEQKNISTHTHITKGNMKTVAAF